jgi:hypothetical protein
MGSAEVQPEGEIDPDPSAARFRRRFILHPGTREIEDLKENQIIKLGVANALAGPSAISAGHGAISSESPSPESGAGEILN